MPANNNQITIPSDKLLNRIMQLEQENEALKYKLNAAIPDPLAESSTRHHYNIFAFLEQTNQIAHVGGWEIDLINNKVYWTAVTRQIHEVKEPFEPTIATAIYFYKEGISRDTINNVVNNALKNGAPFDEELQIITAKGNERWVRAKGRAEFFKETPIRIVGTFQDINEEKLKEKAFINLQQTLQQSEQQYKSLFDQNPAGVFALNNEGNFTSVNDAMTEKMGCSKDILLHTAFLEFINESQKEQIAAQLIAALKGESQKAIINLALANGSSIIVSLILLPIVVNKCITGLYGIATDITAGKRLKQALIASEDSLRAIFESTDIGQIMMNKELIIQSFNTSAANYTLTEHKKKLAEQEHFLSYFPAEKHEKLMLIISRVLNGAIESYEKEISHDFGNNHWFKIKFSPVISSLRVGGLVMTIEDITQQKIAIDLIKNERNQLRTLIENIPDAIYIKDINARKTITNRVDLQFIGAFSEEAVIGKTDLELFEGVVGEIGYADDIQIITTGVPVINKEEEFTDREGNKHWLLTTKVPLLNEQHKINGLLGIGRIITQQKIDQAAIKKSNERFEYVTKATFDAIWDWDIITNELYRGEGFETIFGYNLKTFDGTIKNWEDLVHPADKERVLTKFNKFLESNNGQWQDEYRFLKADGTYAAVIDKAVILKDEHGKNIRMIGAMQDITLQKKEEQQLRLFESVVKNISDAVLITEAEPFTGPNGPKIVFANEAFVSTTGYTKEEVIGLTPRILQGPKTDRKELNKLNVAFKKWEPVEVELINYKKNGEEYWVNLSMVPLANEQGWYTHWICVQRDVTTKKRAEEELNLFYEIAGFINTEYHFDAVVEKVITSIATYLKFDFAEAWLVNFDNSKMTYRANFLSGDKNTASSGYNAKTVLEKGQGLPGAAFQQKKMMYWDDLKQSPCIKKENALIAGFTSGMALPVLFNGEVVAVFTFFSKVPFTPQQLKAGILTKITNELGAGIQKNRTEAELNSFFSLSPDMLCIIGTDGYFKKVNPAFTQIIGFSEKEFLTTPQINFIHPHDNEKTAAETSRLLRGGQTAYFENRYITKSKAIVWLAWSFTAILDEGLVFAIAKDITYKKKLEEERTRILESISDFFYALDANFNFSYINTAAKNLMSKRGSKLEGKSIWEVMPALKNSEFYSKAIEAVNTKKPVHFEYLYQANNTWYEESFYPTEDGLSVFFRSVNSRKQSEAKLNELNKVLAKNVAEMASSNAELERFAYVASHDLQEPLRMVSGFMQLLLKKYDPVLDEDGKKYINFAIDGAARMKILIHDLLHYSRAGAGEIVLENVNMNQVMADVKMIVRPSMMATNATVFFDTLPAITSNILMVTQLLQNLVGNAIKYQEAGNKPIINISCKQKSTEWEFAVQDNGIGIEKGFEEKIFEVFNRLHTKQQYSGTGIGLSICKKIVEKLGGKIWVEPNIGAGSIFKFTLPA